MAAIGEAVILGSLRGTRRLDALQSAPAALQTIEPARTTLDWTLHALSAHQAHRITYVGGYQIQKVMERYPALTYCYHASWEHEGELAALLTVPSLPPHDCVIVRATMLILPEALQRLREAPGHVIIGDCARDSGQRQVGIIAMHQPELQTAYAVAQRLVQRDRLATLDHWAEALLAESVPAVRLHLDGAIAPITDQLALARTLFRSKARTLEHIRPLVTRAIVLDQIRFNVREWSHDAARIVAKVADSFGQGAVIVRSSAQLEDGLEESLAGRFRSVLDVPAHDDSRLRDAVTQVMESYQTEGRRVGMADEVFVQPQIRQLAASGVLLTRDPETGAPYCVLNLDRLSGRSDGVTSGAETACDTIYTSRQALLSRLPRDVRTCLAVGQELEELLHLDALDIELGIDRLDQVYLFQVRPLSSRARKFELADEDI